MTERVRSWHECLYKLLPQSGPVNPALRRRFEMGRGVHGVIEGMFPRAATERRERYAEEGLPFAIDYHPDVWDSEVSRVWEIKPVGWFFSHYDYCLAQLSGYRHFAQASMAGFILYKLRKWNGGRTITADDIDGPWPYVPASFNSWDYLRKISLESDALLIEKGR